MGLKISSTIYLLPSISKVCNSAMPVYVHITPPISVENVRATGVTPPTLGKLAMWLSTVPKVCCIVTSYQVPAPALVSIIMEKHQKEL